MRSYRRNPWPDSSDDSWIQEWKRFREHFEEMMSTLRKIKVPFGSTFDTDLLDAIAEYGVCPSCPHTREEHLTPGEGCGACLGARDYEPEDLSSDNYECPGWRYW